MAKAIAHITGTALRPGVSRNNRWYKPEHIAGAVARAQKRIAAGENPMVMLTVHPDGPIDSAGISASLTGMSLDEAGNARFTASIADTSAGRDMASLADTSDGKLPHLRNVSIRGHWLGTVRRVKGPAGGIVETGDDLELDGLEFTPAPGVSGAQIDTFAWAAGGSRTETDERVPISESVEAAVTFTETTDGETGPEPAAVTGGAVPVVPEGVREAVRAVFAPAEAHVLEDGLCATCGDVEEARKANTAPYGDVPYADPGYLDANGKQASSSGKPGIKRYPLDKKHIRAAWSYINQARNAGQYTAGQLKRIKGRIKSAMRSIGAKVSAESDVVAGFVIGEAVEAPAAVLEWLGDDPKRSGSWSVTASNGPVSLSLSSYCMDPADLDVILRAAAGAAATALKRLDPDMDGDVDVPGAASSDTGGDGGHETAPEDDPPATETAPSADGGEGPAPAGDTESEDSMPETATTTEAGAGAPAGLTTQGIAEAVAAAFAARDEAKRKAKKAARDAAAKEAREEAARAHALAEALKKLGIKVPVTEGTDAGGTAAAGSTGGALTEADVEKRVNDSVAEALTEFKQQLFASGPILPSRAGIVVREHAIPDADNAPSGEDLRKMSNDDLLSYMGGAMAQQADAIRPVGAG